jgi:hypothetical protein
MREHPDVFPPDSVHLMFSNIEKIFRFQQTFLEALRLAIPNNRIGEVFIEYVSDFYLNWNVGMSDTDGFYHFPAISFHGLFAVL